MIKLLKFRVMARAMQWVTAARKPITVKALCLLWLIFRDSKIKNLPRSEKREQKVEVVKEYRR